MLRHWRMSLLCSNWSHQPVSLEKPVSVSLLWIQLSLLLHPPSIFFSLFQSSVISPLFSHSAVSSSHIISSVPMFLKMMSVFVAVRYFIKEHLVIISFCLLSHFVSLSDYFMLTVFLCLCFSLISSPFSSHLLPVFSPSFSFCFHLPFILPQCFFYYSPPL